MKQPLIIIICALLFASCTRQLATKSQLDTGISSTLLSSTNELTTSDWTKCAIENGVCSFVGTRNVVYGPSITDLRIIIKPFTSSTPCTNNVFGDLAPGVIKYCYYQNTVLASPTPSTPVVSSPVVVVSPVIKFVSVPASGSTQTLSQISFSVVSSSTNNQIQCSLDSAAFSNCTSPVAVMSPVGIHVFSVKAIDLTNNLSATLAYSWSVAAATTIVTNINSGTMGMPYVNLSLAPAPSIGKNYIDLIPHQAGNVPILHTGVEANNGEVRIQCGFSHMLNDDPIVYPNQAGRAHLHTFFGNTGANSTSTSESLKASGNSTCDGGIMNRSAYWVPTPIDTRTGRPIKPDGSNMYYKTEDSPNVVSVPVGLRVIAGSMAASASQEHLHWLCVDQGDNNVSGDQGYIPACAVGNRLKMYIEFPAWWDGVNLDSADHKSHMSFVKDATHTVHIPDITYNVAYTVHVGDDTTKWRLSSDMYDTSKPGGYSLHADYMFGWNSDPVTNENFSHIFWNKCLRASMECGNSLLGDGRQYSY